MIIEDLTNISNQLGIPSLLGVLLGGILSYFPIRWQLSQQTKKDKQRIAEKIISSIFNYNIVLENIHFQKKIGKKESETQISELLASVNRIDESIGLAKLYIDDEISEKIVSVKRIIGELSTAIVNKTYSEKRELPEYKKFSSETDIIVNKLKKWTNK